MISGILAVAYRFVRLWSSALAKEALTAVTQMSLRQFGTQVCKDLHELSRRMVLNIFVTNDDDHLRNPGCLFDGTRSEERRVGNECDRTCRSRWSPDH